jgi:uncharacterized iron-regulated membrane protein
MSMSLDYRAVWRWHFYAGLFCIPFVMWLAATGAIYLFRPQIDAWLDQPYDGLTLGGTPAPPAQLTAAALATVPGSVLNSYELPLTPRHAVRVVVGKGGDSYRVYVHPETAKVLHVVDEAQEPMTRLFFLHGELAQGAKGSALVETAASWAVVMILTGIFLWWPRKARGLGGILYPRLGGGRQLLWRDLHAVTGVWVSFFALFLIMSGLPWAKSWGSMIKGFRQAGSTAVVTQDWAIGEESERQAREAMNTPAGDEHAGHAGHTGEGRPPLPEYDYSPLDRIVPTVAALRLAPPVRISPPSQAAPTWTARSDALNRPKRTNLVMDPRSGAVLSRQDFSTRPVVDRIVGFGIAAHEGQLFGWMNQALGLLTAIGLELMCVSAIALWWRRRPSGVLGALAPLPHSRVPALVFVVVGALGLVFPLLGLSLLAVLFVERLVLVRIACCRNFLGLRASSAA